MSKKIVNIVVGSLGGIISIPLMKELIIFLLSMSPILELRGGMLAASLFNMNPVSSFIICVLGNIIPIPFILWFMNKILKYLRGSKHFKNIARWLDKKVDKNRKIIDKYGALGLIVFVGIPLPGTGAWTGCLVASVLEIDKKKAFISASVGVLMAAIIMLIFSFGILSNII